MCCVAQTTDQYPVPKSVFDDPTMQPYIHDCLVHVHEGEHTYQFRIFFKCHCRLCVNQTMHISDGHPFRGDALVMRVGACDCHSVVNMREHDTILSDFVINKYVFSVHLILVLI